MDLSFLSGVRVLDLTSVVVGPSCTQRLADFGAEVIKLEPPEGDVLRSLGGPSPSGRHSGMFLHFNRKKRMLCLNLKQPDARTALLKVLDGCDVLVSNMRPDALQRLGLDAVSVRSTRPNLVHCMITGFGPGGPYRGRPAYDPVVQSVAGIAGLSERRDGAARYAPLLICDHVTGEIAAGAIMAALVGRARTGVGSTIEVPMHETMAAFVLQEHLGPATFTPPLGPAGYAPLLDPNHQPVATADGWITISAATDAQVRSFLTTIGRSELLDDPRFRTVADRMRNVGAWIEVRRAAIAAIKEQTTEHWLTVLAAADVPAAPCHTLETIMDDPQLAAVGLLVAETHDQEGEIRSIRPTILDDGLPGTVGRAARPIGWDTRVVLTEAGLAESEIGALLQMNAAHDGQAG
ncbi:CaiB/BaiF CoA transferase family protein [Rhodopila globiformis]|uniref:CoA transferase n=1 Tax=Rhodopila globiformis TaxID=1071 RepID=A0A2S6N7L7_RHOGL|nr:CoA transferase [Rhodopila globiformis]PPQ30587.1 CoA transferase [Rhodopila globiformis]